MAAPKIYKSTDAGAPVLSGTLGAFIALLDAVLVNGYGTKQPLGWTKEFSGPYTAVYRPASGLRILHRFDNSSGNMGSGYSYVTVSTYDTMTDVDTGLGCSGVSYFYLASYYVSVSLARPWVIIGDDRGFYFIFDQGYGHIAYGYFTVNFFGETIPIVSTDVWHNVITGKTYDAHADFGMGNTDDGTDYARYYRYHKSRTGVTVGARTFLRGGGPYGSSCMGSTNISGELAYPYDGKLMYTQPYIVGDASDVPRSFLPGLYASLHGQGLTDRQVYVDGTKQLMAFYYTYMAPDYNGWLFIDIGEGFRP